METAEATHPAPSRRRAHLMRRVVVTSLLVATPLVEEEMAPRKASTSFSGKVVQAMWRRVAWEDSRGNA